MCRLDSYSLELIFLLVPDTIPNIYRVSKEYAEIIDKHHILKKLKNYDQNTNELFTNAIVEFDLQFLKYLNDTSINYFHDYYYCRWMKPGEPSELDDYQSLRTIQLCRYQLYLRKKQYYDMVKEIHKKLDIQTFKNNTTCIYNIGLFEKIIFPDDKKCQCYKNMYANCKTGCLTFIHNNIISVFSIDEEKVHHPISIAFNDMNFTTFLVQIYNPIKIQSNAVLKNNIPIAYPKDVNMYNLEIYPIVTNFLITIDVNKYIHIGLDVIEFETYDEIIEFTAYRYGVCVARDSKYIYILNSEHLCETNCTGFVKLMSSDVTDEDFHNENYWARTMYYDLHVLEMKARLI